MVKMSHEHHERKLQMPIPFVIKEDHVKYQNVIEQRFNKIK